MPNQTDCIQIIVAGDNVTKTDNAFDLRVKNYIYYGIIFKAFDFLEIRFYTAHVSWFFDIFRETPFSLWVPKIYK